MSVLVQHLSISLSHTWCYFSVDFDRIRIILISSMLIRFARVLLQIRATCALLRKRQNEKALRGDANTAAGCSKAEPKNFSPRRAGAGRPKFNQLEMVTTFTTNPVC